MAHLHSELTKYKTDYHNLKSISDEEKLRHIAESERLSEDLSDIDLRYQKEKSLLEQQLEFKEKSKNDSITDLQQRIHRLETVNHQLVESKTSEKSKSDKSNYEITRLYEEKYSHKILELS